MLKKIEFSTGVYSDEPEISAEGRFVAANNMRYSRGLFEPVGGWSKVLDGLVGKSRGAFSYVAGDNKAYLAIGTHRRLYVVTGNVARDITPGLTTSTETLVFEVNSSDTIAVVTLANHGLVATQLIKIQDASSLVFGIDVNDTFEVATVIDSDHFTIDIGAPPGIAILEEDEAEYLEEDGTLLLMETGSLGVGSAGYFLSDESGDLIVNESGDAIQIDSGSTATITCLFQRSVLSDGLWVFTESWTDGLEYAAAGSGWGVGAWSSGAWGGARASSVVEPPLTWSFGAYADDLIACPRGRQIYRWDATTGGRAVAISGAPSRTDFIFVTPERFLFALGTIEYGGSTYDPMLVRWPDQTSLTTWTPTGTNSARFQVLGTGSRLIAGTPSRAQSLIWSDSAFYAARYIGDTELVYGFDLLGTSCGLIGPNAWAEKDGLALWMSPSVEFMIYDGSAPRALDCPITDLVKESFRYGDAFAVYCGINHEYDEAWWWYPQGSATPELSRLVIYNYREDKWFPGDVARTSWVRKADDSRVFGVSPDGALYEHETGRDRTGSGMAYIETALFDLADGDRTMKVSRLMFDRKVDADTEMDVVISSKRWPFDEVEQTKRLTLSATRSYVDTKIAGRQMKIRWEAPTATSWWRQGDVRVDMVASGRR